MKFKAFFTETGVNLDQFNLCRFCFRCHRSGFDLVELRLEFGSVMEVQQKRGGGGGGLVPLSPLRDLRSADSNSSGYNKYDKEKGVNVQVLVRCRPLNEDEIRLHTPFVISCNEGRREVAAVQSIANKQIDRTFVFNKVFGPTSQQKELYDQAVSPIVYEVLEGYNCTIFAYGQTGTGKTYTMEGGAIKKI